MTMEVAPGIFQVILPLPGFALKAINAYLIRGDDGWLLVDCGWNTFPVFDALQSTLAELNISFKDIRQIVVTHIHPDHFGMVGRLVELCGCSYAISETEARLIEPRYVHMDNLLVDLGNFLGKHGVPADEVAALKTASMPVLRFVAPALPETLLKGGEVIEAGKYRFKVLFTPGHSPGHICLYDSNSGVLLAGDQVLWRQTPNVSLHAQQQGNPLLDFLESLRLLDTLDVSLVLPGHDETSRDLHGRVRELLEHHARRNEEVLQILNREAMTAYEVAPKIGWVTSAAAWQKMPSLDKRFALHETLAHLEYLTSLSMVHKIAANGKIIFQKS